MAKSKTIPVMIGDRVVQRIDERRPVISRVYDKWWRIFGIKKIYHVAGRKVVIETAPSLPYVLQTRD